MSELSDDYDAIGHDECVSEGYYDRLEYELASAQEELAKVKADRDNWGQYADGFKTERDKIKSELEKVHSYNEHCRWKSQAERYRAQIEKAFKIINNCHAICSEDGMDCVAETSEILEHALSDNAGDEK